MRVVRWLSIGCLLILCLTAAGQSPTEFMGRKVTIIRPKVEDGRFSKGPASVCLEAPPRQQCYVAPQSGNFPFGNNPTVELVELEKGQPASFFRQRQVGLVDGKSTLPFFDRGPEMLWRAGSSGMSHSPIKVTTHSGTNRLSRVRWSS